MAARPELVDAKAGEASGSDWLFRVFSAWTVVLLCRPQDIFPFLAVFRPAIVGAVLTLCLFLFKLPSLRKPKYLQENQIKRYMGLVAVMIVGIPFSLYARLSFMTVFTSYINVIVFVLIFYKVINSVPRLTRLILLCCLGSGLYAIFSVISGNFAASRLVFGQMFDPNDLAFYSLSFLPLNLVFISKDNPLWVRLSCLGSIGAGTLLIFLTGSRGGMLAFAVSALLMLTRKTRTITGKSKIILLVIFLVFIMAAPIDMERYATLLTIGSDYNVYDETGRMALWKTGLSWMLTNPFTGVGVGCFGNAIGLDRQARGAETLAWQAPHNSVVQIGTETGVVGLLLYLTMTTGAWRTFLRGTKIPENESLKKFCEMGLIGFTGLFVSGLFLSQAYSVLWAFYIVLSAVANQMLFVTKNARLNLRGPGHAS